MTCTAFVLLPSCWYTQLQPEALRPIAMANDSKIPFHKSTKKFFTNHMASLSVFKSIHITSLKSNIATTSTGSRYKNKSNPYNISSGVSFNNQVALLYTNILIFNEITKCFVAYFSG
jgi:hypothetical protein